jgi:hypothetical protein
MEKKRSVTPRSNSRRRSLDGSWAISIRSWSLLRIGRQD